MKLIVIFVFSIFPLALTVLVLPGYQPNTNENLFLLKHNAFSENPEELSGQFEGDIILSEDQANAINDDVNKRTSYIELYNGKLNARWKKNEIPYIFERGAFTEEQRFHIYLQLKKIENLSRSCLKFVIRKTHKDYIGITGHKGCYSNVGRIGGQQILNLQPDKPNRGCLLNGTILHEVLHALGFFHMHASPDRDKYVEIFWDNIQEAGRSNFQILKKNMAENYGFKYDLLSILHYGAYAYAKNRGLTTIEPHDRSFRSKIGQRKGFTRTDLGKLFKMYKCNINVDKIPVDRDGIVIT